MNVAEREMIISTIKNDIGKRLADMYKGNKAVNAAIKNISKSLKIKQKPSVIIKDDVGKFVSAKDPNAQKIIVKDEVGNSTTTDRSEGDGFYELLNKIANKDFQNKSVIENNIIPRFNDIVMLCDTLSITNERMNGILDSMQMVGISSSDDKVAGYLEDLTDMKKDKENDAYYADESTGGEKKYGSGFKGFQDKLFDKIDEIIESLSYGNNMEDAQTGILASMSAFLGLKQLGAWFSGFFALKGVKTGIKGFGKFLAFIPMLLFKGLWSVVKNTIGKGLKAITTIPFVNKIFTKTKGVWGDFAKKTKGIWAKVGESAFGKFFGTFFGGFLKVIGGLLGRLPIISALFAAVETIFADDKEIARVTGESGRGFQYFITKFVSNMVMIVDLITWAFSWLTGWDLNMDLAGKSEKLIKDFMDWFRDFSFSDWIGGLWGSFTNWITGLWTDIKDWMWNTGGLKEVTAVFGMVYDKLMDLVDWFKNFSFTDWISGLWNEYNNWVNGLLEGFMEWSDNLDMVVIGLLNDLGKWFEDFSFRDWIGELWDGLKGFVSNMWDDIMDELKMLWVNLKDLGYNYIKNLPGSIIDWVTGDNETSDENKSASVYGKKFSSGTGGENVKPEVSEYKRFFDRNNTTDNIVELKKRNDPTVEGAHNVTSNKQTILVNNNYNMVSNTDNTSINGGGGGMIVPISARGDGLSPASRGSDT